MRSVILPAVTALGLAAIGLTGNEAIAQSAVQPPRLDCQQAAGLQPVPANPQKQSCNIVFKDPDLLTATTGEMIQALVNATPSLPDGPFIRVDLPAPNNLDYITKSVSTNSGGPNAIDISAGEISTQIGFDPGVTTKALYTLNGTEVKIWDNLTAGNQILSGCPDGVALVKNGGKNQTVTVIGGIDMWFDDPDLGLVCGVKFTADHTVNLIGLFYAVGPSGFVSTGDITAACADLNAVPASMAAPVAQIIGSAPEAGNTTRSPINITGCFGDATYCNSAEAAGLPNSCNATNQQLSGVAQARSSTGLGTPPGFPVAAAQNEVAAEALLSGSSSTTVFSGGLSGGIAVPCCTFP